MSKIKHSDLAAGMELPYQDARNHAYRGVIRRVLPRIADWPGRGWKRYQVQQRGPHGLNPHWVERTIGEINREFRLP